MIEVVDFKSKLGYQTSGFVHVKYYKSTWVCQVCFVKHKDVIWIKLPAVPDSFDKKKFHNVIHFDDKADSDAFQVEVLIQLSRKFPEALKRPDHKVIRRSAKQAKKEYNKLKVNKMPFKKPFKPKPKA